MEIRTEGIEKRYGETVALAPTSLAVRAGEFVSLLGPSGCGKTTLLRSIAGLARPDNGRITLGDQVVFDHNKQINIAPEKRGVGMVFQDFALWPHMTVFENVAFGLRARQQRGLPELLRFRQPTPGQTEKDIANRVDWALQKVRLAGYAQRYPGQLSGGQKQRVSFARAIATGPKLLLLDEPLSALDAILREEMRVELSALVREIGITALYVTHDQSEAMAMSDRIAVMNEGQILQTGTPEDLYNRPADPFVATFIGRSNVVSLNGRYTIVRPERLRLNQVSAADLAFTGTVRQTAFLGERYEVVLSVSSHEEEQLWTSYLPQKPDLGQELTLYVSPDDVHQVTK